MHIVVGIAVVVVVAVVVGVVVVAVVVTVGAGVVAVGAAVGLLLCINSLSPCRYLILSKSLEQMNFATHFAHEEASKRAILVGVVAERRCAGRQRQLNAILQALSVVGLPRRPIDGRVAEIRRRRAPPEVEWASLVVAGRPKHLIRVPHIDCKTKIFIILTLKRAF